MMSRMEMRKVTMSLLGSLLYSFQLRRWEDERKVSGQNCGEILVKAVGSGLDSGQMRVAT